MKSQRLFGVVACLACQILLMPIALCQSGNESEFEKYKTSIKDSPENPELWLNLDEAVKKKYSGRPQPEVWDEFIRAFPSSPFPHLFKSAVYFGWGRHADADAELKIAMRLGPKEPLGWLYSCQIHALNGRYKDALAECNQYTAYGGYKPTDAVANRVVIWTSVVDRQFNGRQLPVSGWKPSGQPEAIASVSNTNGPFIDFLLQYITNVADALGTQSAEKSDYKRYILTGAKEHPLLYAPNLEVWGAEVLYTTQYGILLSNGSNVKYTVDADGSKTIKYGIVKDWRISLEN